MKKYFILMMLFVFAAGFKAHAYEPTGPLKVTGDRNLDQMIEDIGYNASFDESGFIADLSSTYGIPQEKIAGLAKKIYLRNAFIALAISRSSARPLDAIADEYKAGEAKSWGRIMQDLGIILGEKELGIIRKDAADLLKRAKARKEVAEAKVKENLKKLGPAQEEEEEAGYRSRFDYIRKTSKLPGISSCRINSGGSITLADSKNSGYGYTLLMLDPKGAVIDEAVLKPGESCVLTDSRHLTVSYKFLRLKNGRIIFEVTDKFDSRSFGGKVRKQTKDIIIPPYNK